MLQSQYFNRKLTENQIEKILKIKKINTKK